MRGVNLPGESRSSARHWNANMAIEIVNSELRKSTGDEENSSPPQTVDKVFRSQCSEGLFLWFFYVNAIFLLNIEKMPELSGSFLNILSMIFANFFMFMHAKVRPIFMAIFSLPVCCVYLIP